VEDLVTVEYLSFFSTEAMDREKNQTILFRTNILVDKLGLVGIF